MKKIVVFVLVTFLLIFSVLAAYGPSDYQVPSGGGSSPTANSGGASSVGGNGGSCASGYALVSGKCVKTEVVAEEPAKVIEEVKEKQEGVQPSENIVEEAAPKEGAGNSAQDVRKMLINLGLILATVVVVTVLLGVFKYIQKRRSK